MNKLDDLKSRIHTIGDKPYSWLAWPVKLKNCNQDNLHITAKFFGEADIDPFEVILKVDRYISEWPSRQFTWVPTIFSEMIPVLQLMEYPTEMILTHKQYAIIRDPFDDWHPHITVPKSYWDKVLAEDLTPTSENLQLGELTLFYGRQGKWWAK